MEVELKIALTICATLAVVLLGTMASCNYNDSIAAQAPVVESCIKHPSTRSPLKGAQ